MSYKKIVLEGLLLKRIQIRKHGHLGSRGLTRRVLSRKQNLDAEGAEREEEDQQLHPLSRSCAQETTGTRGRSSRPLT